MNTRITIDRFKMAAFASQETLCFEARVLLDGKPVGYHCAPGNVWAVIRGKL